ncbi:hypothetical protein Hanom_Chr01g00065671 [Helianthus anomalus]
MHQHLPMHVHAENWDNIPNVEAAVGPPMSDLNVGIPFDSVGPAGFVCGNGPPPSGLGSANGPLKSKVYRKSSLGPKQRKGKAQVGNHYSPGDQRPLKRSRRIVEEQEDGFGFEFGRHRS